MAVLQKMRDKFGIVISVIIALSLLYFIAPMDDIMTLFGSGENVVGVIDGKKVTYEDFQATVNKYTTVQEIMSGSSIQNEETQKQIRDAAWQDFIDKYLIIKNAKAAGLRVGEDEMLSLTTGENASPMISQNPAFMDEEGRFSSQRVVDFVQNLDADETGRLKVFWSYLHSAIYSQQFYAKYGSMFVNSSIENKLMAQRDSLLNNGSANVDYLTVNYSYTPDSTIVISDSAIKAYYNSHKQNFKQGNSRDIEYVLFEVTPSLEDINALSDEMVSLQSELDTVKNVKSFLLKSNSDRPFNTYWYKDGELKTVNADVDKFVSANKSGTSPVYRKDNTFYAVRVLSAAQVADSAYVKHILLQGENVKAKADSLVGVLKKGGDFSALAAIHSVDQSSADGGQLGNLGWMTQSYIIPGMESVIDAKIGEPYVVNTRYGTHVVLVSKKSAPVLKKRVAILEKTAVATTFNEVYAQANKFATIAGGTAEGYKAALDSLGVYSHHQTVTEATENYGSVDNAKEITRWAFDAKVGKISDIITVNQKYFFIAALDAVHKEGYKPLAEVSSSIKAILENEASQDKKLAEVKDKIAGKESLTEISEALGVELVSNQTLSYMDRQTEPALLGAVEVAQEGQISAPVKGAYGVYVFKVNSRENGAAYTTEDAEREYLQKSQFAMRFLQQVLFEKADVKDNRARFF